MSAIPQIAAPDRRLYLVKEEESGYDADERRPKPGEVAGGVRHVRIPVTVLDDTQLCHSAVICYGWLQQHAGDAGCFPSFETLAKEMRCAVRSAIRYVADLEGKGYVRHRRGGKGRANAYTLYPEGDAPPIVSEPPEIRPPARSPRPYRNRGMADALIRDRGACRVCGFDEVVEVHHIVGRNLPDSHDLINLITLCPTHHALAGRGKWSADALRAFPIRGDSMPPESHYGAKYANPDKDSVPTATDDVTLVATQPYLSNQTSLIKSTPTELTTTAASRPPAKKVGTPKQPTPTVEAAPPERERVPRAKRASADAKPSGDAFGLVGWLLKEQGGIARAEWQKVADAKAADAVIARLGGVEAAREHATARLMEARRTTLLWAHILEDVLRAAAARQRGVVERRATGPAVSAADGFGAVARRARGEEEDDDQGRDGRVAATTFDGVARPL